MLRQINELVDFSFVQDELQNKYCLDNGRNVVPPIRMFKYLLLKSIFDVSDVDVVERSKYDMSFKYFLDMAPEDGVINPCSLTKFRKIRLKDVNLLDMLIQKTVDIALEKEIIKSSAIILDATHTKARFNQKSPKEILIEKSKLLRKTVYQIDEKLNYLKEVVEDHHEKLQLSNDSDACVGHKTADSSFFGYKTHLAINEERIITAAVITTGEKSDGKQLQTWIEKSRETGMKIDTVIGDTAYSDKNNIQYTNQNEFEFNKDAGMYVCKAGHMAIRKARQEKKNTGEIK